MAISVRKRGKNWYARGTVRIGRENVTVPEFNTGASSRADALEAGNQEAARVKQERTEGPDGRARRLTIADCLSLYEAQNPNLKPYDLDRVEQFNDAIGSRPLLDAALAWQDWRRMHPKHSLATVQRWRTILAAAIRVGCEANLVPVPKLPAVKQQQDERLVYLSKGERSALLRAYSPYAACPVLLLAYQGMRTQEALRLDWRAVDLTRETIYLQAWDREREAPGTKTRRGRTVPMHPRVRMLLVGMHEAAGRPHIGPVFLSSRGAPYEDTRGAGGNPLKKQHENACVAAGITGFRVHDWRHDWAARCVMGGMDLMTLMRLGGWSSLKMVEKYASVTAEHMRDALHRVA